MKFFGKKKERTRPSSGATDIEAARQSVSGPTIELSDSKKEPLISKVERAADVLASAASNVSATSAAVSQVKSRASFSSTKADPGPVVGATSSMQAETGVPSPTNLATTSSVSYTGIGKASSAVKSIASVNAGADSNIASNTAVGNASTPVLQPAASGNTGADTNTAVGNASVAVKSTASMNAGAENSTVASVNASGTVGQSTKASNAGESSHASDHVSYGSESVSVDTDTSSISGAWATAPRDDDGWIPTKIPNIRSKAAWKKAVSKITAPLTALASANSAIKVGIVGLVAGAVLLAFANSQQRGPVIAYDADLNVAFIGNSYLFVNDLPRLLEAMSSGHMFQDSCLHGSGSILKILKTGNGMYNRWRTSEAILTIDYEKETNGESRREYQQQLYYENDKILYDFGACSVPQLLLGYDDSISYGNMYGNFYNDGNNPCLQDDDYLDYMNSFNYTESWDFVVITDQSKRMCFEDSRYEAIQGFNYTYVPLLNETKSVPVIIQPHAFNSSSVNMTGLGDIPTFTAMIYQGAEEYKSFLRQELPAYSQRARIAPVGNAYLTVWEEDYELWEKFFLYDDIHPTTYGSYLYGLVIYATIYNVMPWDEAVLREDMSELWMYARKKQLGNYTYPDYDEAVYLFDVAKRVVLKGHVPSSFPNLKSSSSSSSSSGNSTSSSGSN